MLDPLLQAKIYVPPLPHHIQVRQSLTRKLQQEVSATDRPLVLVIAPAGYGKTTLVREWLSGQEDKLAWFSIDEHDSDASRFWIYLIAALQKGNPKLGTVCLEMLRSTDQRPGTGERNADFLVPLLNDLFLDNRSRFLVIDDYHLIGNRDIHTQMSFFIENLPPHITLVITTRSDPPWPLARWRARNALVERRMKDLAFSEDETMALLSRQVEVPLAKAQMQILHRKTEGWIAGIKLIAASLASAHDQNHFIEKFSGSNRHVLHFLLDEVFTHQPRELQEFLMQTSILTRFCASLCTTLTGRPDSLQILTALEKENLFVILLDEKNLWYRYHPLFAEMLLTRLRQQDPEQIRVLSARASDWFLQHGHPGEAARQALASGDSQKAGQIFHDHYDAILQTNGPALLYDHFARFPLCLQKRYPRLMAHHVLHQLIHEGLQPAASYLSEAQNLSYEDSRQQKEYEGILAAVQTYCHIYTGNFEAAWSEAQTADGKLAPDNHYWRMNIAIYLGDANLFAGNPRNAYPHYLKARENSHKLRSRILNLHTGFKTAVSLKELGELNRATALTEDLLRIAKNEGLTTLPRTGLIWALHGDLLREQGHLEAAQRDLERGIHFSESEKPCQAWNLLLQVALCYSTQNYDEGLRATTRIEIMHREVTLPDFIVLPCQYWLAKLHLKRGHGGLAHDVLASAGIRKTATAKPGQEKGWLALTRLLLFEKKPDTEAIDKILKTVLRSAEISGWQSVRIEALLLKACLAEKQSCHQQSFNLIKEALNLGATQGFFQIFIDEADPIKGLLTKMPKDYALKQGLDPVGFKLWQKLDRAWREATRPNPDASLNDASAELVEKLSERELEVLELISLGLSNQEISDRLFLTLGTVKWHTSNIYGKLGVRGRTQAVAQARKLELLR